MYNYINKDTNAVNVGLLGFATKKLALKTQQFAQSATDLAKNKLI
jgi:hypothetical protein